MTHLSAPLLLALCCSVQMVLAGLVGLWALDQQDARDPVRWTA